MLIPKPKFPNIPKLPGVPQLPRSPSFPATIPPQLGLAVAIGRLWQALFVTPQWGIYTTVTRPRPGSGVVAGGTDTITETRLVVQPSGIQDMGYRNEQTVSNYPVQAGSFAAFNAVDGPFEITLRLTKGGTEQERANFLSDCEYILHSLSRYTILTPERTYTNCKVTRLELQRRGAGGAYWFSEVDLSFMEIREVAAQYTTYATLTEDAQDAAARPTLNDGRVSPATPPAGAVFDSATSLGVTP